jgi:hypothetical protein
LVCLFWITTGCGGCHDAFLIGINRQAPLHCRSPKGRSRSPVWSWHWPHRRRDERALKFAYDYSEKLLAIDVNIEITQMLDTAWELFAKYFSKEEVAIKSELVEKYWPKTE